MTRDPLRQTDMAQDDGMNRVLTRNIDTLRAKREHMLANSPLSDRLAGAVTRFTGSVFFVVLHVALVAFWVAINLDLVPAIQKFDPTFVILATVASVEAIFLSTFVLISQNRAAALADQRADLDLQINLLAEHEITQLVTLITRIADKLGVDVDQHKVEDLKRDVAPEAVLDRISEREQANGSS